MKKRLNQKYTFYDWRRTKKVPVPSEVVENDIVKWGRKNDYPFFLNTLLEKSPTHSGIIRGKVYHIAGGGVTVTGGADVEFIQKNGTSEYNLAEVVQQCTEDYEIYNGFCFRGVWDMLTGKPKYIEHVEFDLVRTNEDETIYYFSDGWGDYNRTVKEYRPIDFKNRVGEFLVYFKEKSKKNNGKKLGNIYPMPFYSGAIEAIMTEIEINAYHLHAIMNEFKTGKIVYLPTAQGKSDEDKLAISNDLKEGATDREAANGVMVIFGEGGTEKPEVLNLDGNDLDKRYLQTEEHVVESIMRGHSINSPSLFGLRTQGKLGDTQEMEVGLEIFKKVYVQSRQKKINYVFDWFIKKSFGNEYAFKLNESEFKISIAQPQMPVENIVQRDEDFLAKDPVLKKFEEKGLKKNNFVFLKSQSVPHEFDADWFEKSEQEIMNEYKNEKIYFAIALTETQKNILELINQKQDALNIAKALDIKVGDVINEYAYLSEKKLINVDGTVSASGLKYLEKQPADISNFEIRYSYELRPDAPKLKGESRPFCKALMSADKLYTRAEIEEISTELGSDTNQFDVWRYRGGWYSNPQTKQNTPYCRHIWMQNLVTRK